MFDKVGLEITGLERDCLVVRELYSTSLPSRAPQIISEVGRLLKKSHEAVAFFCDIILASDDVWSVSGRSVISHFSLNTGGRHQFCPEWLSNCHDTFLDNNLPKSHHGMGSCYLPTCYRLQYPFTYSCSENALLPAFSKIIGLPHYHSVSVTCIQRYFAMQLPRVRPSQVGREPL